MSFLPPASCDPDDKDIAGYVGLIRETVKKKPPSGVLMTLTSFMHAVALYCLHQFGHVETLAILKQIKTRVEETDHRTGKRGTVVSPF